MRAVVHAEARRVRSDVRAVAGQQGGCMSRGQLRRLGLSDAAIDNEIRRGRLLPALRDVHRLPEVDPLDPRVRAWSAVLSQERSGAVPPGVAASHQTAAAVWGLEGCPRGPLDHVVVPAGWAGHSRRGLRLHRTTLPPGGWCQVDGLPVTSVAQTVLHLAGVLPRTTAVAVADSALRTGTVSRSELVVAAARASGRWSARARGVVDLSREEVDSCPETRLRLLLVDSGLPEPVVGLTVRDEIGTPVARADLAYADAMVWIEYDGYEVHSERSAFRRDRRRQNTLVGRGWLVLRFADLDLRRPHLIADQVRAALGIGPTRVGALPAGLSAEADQARAALILRLPAPVTPIRPIRRRRSA